MATTARGSSRKGAAKKSAKRTPAKRATKKSAKRTPAKRATKSAGTKTAARRRHITGADTHKTPGRKTTREKEGGKPSSAQACWPGYEATPGKKAGEKGSCKPKAHKTAAQKKGDQKAAAAARLSGQRS